MKMKVTAKINNGEEEVVLIGQIESAEEGLYIDDFFVFRPEIVKIESVE